MRTTLREPLADGHGRAIGDVRISVTDRCNFRCQYCMPAEGLPWLERQAVLSYEESGTSSRRAPTRSSPPEGIDCTALMTRFQMA